MKSLERNREGDFLFRLRDFIFCEGVFAMRMKHPILLRNIPLAPFVRGI